MDEILKAIENQWLAMWIKSDPSPFAFPGILLLHTIGMGVVFGINAGIDLRILGLAKEIPLAPLKKFLPVLWVGFWINAVTGTLLYYADIRTKTHNPDFWIKMVFIALAVVNVRMIKNRVFGDPDVDSKPIAPEAKVLAVTSLIFWIGAIVAGRLLAYVGPVSGLS